MTNSKMKWMGLVFMSMLCGMTQAADDSVTSVLKSEPGAAATFSGTTLYVDMRLDANASLHQAWPSGGTTWHYGVTGL